MDNRRIISYALFIIGVVLFLLLGLARGQWATGVLLGLAFEVAGIIFYRRGK